MFKSVISLPPKTIIGYRKNGKPIFNIAGGSAPLGDTGAGGGGYDGGLEGEGQPQGTGVNPNWNEYLQDIPQELHEKVIPAFQKWDQNVQSLVQKVHSEYEPWKDVVKSGYDPQTAQFALNLVNTLNTDPRQVWEALGEHYGFTPQQAQQFVQEQLGQQQLNGGAGQGQSEPTVNDPYQQHISQLYEQNRILAESVFQQRQKELAAQADAELDAELNELRSKHGEFNERFVLGLMNTGLTGEQAVQEYFNAAGEIAKSYRPKPLIMGTGGGAPGQTLDPKKLSDKGAKDLTVQMLEHAFRNAQ